MISVTDVQSTYSNYSTNTSGVLKGAEDTSNTSTSSMDVASLGKDDFLKLLLAELKNQDPLNPADNTEFVAQLAQFSSLEQMTQMNESLQLSLDANTALSGSINNAMMVNYFGKDVAAETNMFNYSGEGDAEFTFMLNDPVINASINIVDESGNVVRHFSLESLSKGMKAVKWDGLTDRGLQAPDGLYTYEFQGENLTGGDAEIIPFFTGTVNGIIWSDGKANLSIDGVPVPFDKITGITEPVE